MSYKATYHPSHDLSSNQPGQGLSFLAATSKNMVSSEPESWVSLLVIKPQVQVGLSWGTFPTDQCTDATQCPRPGSGARLFMCRCWKVCILGCIPSLTPGKTRTAGHPRPAHHVGLVFSRLLSPAFFFKNFPGEFKVQPDRGTASLVLQNKGSAHILNTPFPGRAQGSG